MVKWLAVVVALLFSTAAAAQNIITSTGPGQYSIMIAEDAEGKTFMRYNGAFIGSSGSAITNYLSAFPIEYIEFHSPGGALLEINGPGDMLREMDVKFVVREGEVCVSACAFLALYSRDLQLDGLIAFHLPYLPGFDRRNTLYDISQSMVERTMRMSRQMFQNDWLLYLYLTIARESDAETYVVFDNIDELLKFKMHDKDDFMDRPPEDPVIIKMTDTDLENYISTHN